MWKYLGSARFWLVLIGACALIGFAEAAQTFAGAADRGRPIPWSRAMSATMPSWFVHLALLPGVVWVATRFRFEAGRRRVSLAAHLGACIVFGLTHLAVTSWLSDYVFFSGFPLTYWDNLKRLFTVYFISIEVGYYWAFVGVTFAVDYRGLFRERERAADDLALKASRLEASLARANLEALRMQLNPHFLFNTLNAISVLAMKGERQTVVRMLARLSDLLRLSFENTDPVVPLAEELALLEPYLEIEQVRFRDRLQVLRRIDDETLDAEVPTLFLQPLVENAVRHGIAQRSGAGQIEIRARRAGTRLEVTVRDTGPGFSAGSNGSVLGAAAHAGRARGNVAEARQGVGLANTQARLEQLYGGDARLETENATDGGAIVRVILPFRTHEGETAFLARTDSRTA